ncbi:MAG TPA: metallophosphoesterase, partial [Deltaproteobacteria bacterium]|nr:metallophosphoesterase [Deltaproteobacteria bacterium]
SEKQALGWYLDGRVSVIVGTHTHVPTADERILPHGTAYITDVGMTGAFESVIGFQYEIVIERLLSQLPATFKVAKKNIRLQAVLVDIDTKSGKALSIKRIEKHID